MIIRAKIHLLNESCDNVTDIDTEYDHFECEVSKSKAIDKHVPVKHHYPRKNSIPYMNRELRKAMYSNQMLRNKYEKYHTDKTWETYRKQHNLVTKLKKRSVRTYFLERCIGGHKANNFWPTVKPFLSKKSAGGQQKIVLMENDVIPVLND